MKLTRLDILQFDALIVDIKNNVDSKELKPFNYALLKNTLKFKKFLKERDTFRDLLYEDWKKTAEDPNDQQAFFAFIQELDEWKKFLEEEVDFEFYTIKLSSLEKEDYDVKVATAFLETIIIDE